MPIIGYATEILIPHLSIGCYAMELVASYGLGCSQIFFFLFNYCAISHIQKSRLLTMRGYLACLVGDREESNFNWYQQYFKISIHLFARASLYRESTRWKCVTVLSTQESEVGNLILHSLYLYFYSPKFQALVKELQINISILSRLIESAPSVFPYN